MWSDGEPIVPSHTIDQATNGDFPWLEIQRSRCKSPIDVDLAALKHPPTTSVHDPQVSCVASNAPKQGVAHRRPCSNLVGSRVTLEGEV